MSAAPDAGLSAASRPDPEFQKEWLRRYFAESYTSVGPVVLDAYRVPSRELLDDCEGRRDLSAELRLWVLARRVGALGQAGRILAGPPCRTKPWDEGWLACRRECARVWRDLVTWAGVFDDDRQTMRALGACLESHGVSRGHDPHLGDEVYEAIWGFSRAIRETLGRDRVG